VLAGLAVTRPALLRLLLATQLALALAFLAPVPATLAALFPARLALLARVDLRQHRPVLVARLLILEFPARQRGRGQVVAIDRRQLLLFFAERDGHLHRLGILGRNRLVLLGDRLDRGLGDDL